MSMSDDLENNLLKLIFNATAWANYADNAAGTPQVNIHCALHTADPGEAGTMSTSETTYTSYTASVSPVAAISFPAGTGGSGTVTHFSTGKTGGGTTPILFSGTVTPNIVTGNGITPQLTTATAITLD
jgi:hypothetical protein